MTIREARPDDARQLIAHTRRILAEPENYNPLTPDEFQITIEEQERIVSEFVAADNSRFFVAEEDGQLIGVLTCRGGRRLALRHCVVLGMSVAKEWRNQGVGSLLMAYAIEWAKQTGLITRIELMVYANNLAAIHLYEKYGFVREGNRRRVALHNGQYMDDVLMSLLL